MGTFELSRDFLFIPSACRERGATGVLKLVRSHAEFDLKYFNLGY